MTANITELMYRLKVLAPELNVAVTMKDNGIGYRVKGGVGSFLNKHFLFNRSVILFTSPLKPVVVVHGLRDTDDFRFSLRFKGCISASSFFSKYSNAGIINVWMARKF